MQIVKLKKEVSKLVTAEQKARAAGDLKLAAQLSAVVKKFNDAMNDTAAEPVNEPQPAARTYVVRAGDTLGAIAQAYRTTIASIKDVTGLTTQLSTAGGTSDGRFIAPAGAQVVEVGPVNATIHKLNEEVLATDLPRLAAIYRGIMERLLPPSAGVG